MGACSILACEQEWSTEAALPSTQTYHSHCTLAASPSLLLLIFDLKLAHPCACIQASPYLTASCEAGAPFQLHYFLQAPEHVLWLILATSGAHSAELLLEAIQVLSEGDDVKPLRTRSFITYGSSFHGLMNAC